jgi:hypothetical protein
MQKTLAVYCWPPHVQAEGVNAVLDNLQQAGVNTVSTAPYVAEPTDPANADRREPPDEGRKNKEAVRIIDRPLWGKREQYLRNAPSFAPNAEMYRDMKFAPREADELTASQGDVVGNFIDEAHRRGMRIYIQMGPSALPRLRAGLDESELMDDMPRMPDGSLPGERMVNFAAIASPSVQEFFAATARDVLTTYPEADGLLLDRMEQSFYSFPDAFIDFGPHAERAAAAAGFDFDAMRSATQAILDGISSLTNAHLIEFADGRDVPFAMASAFRDNPAIADVLAFRSAVTEGYLKRIRQAADSVRPGVELVPITFPPPMSMLTGADFSKYSRHVDAVMIKFFTMHWPMIVTYWSQSIVAINPALDPGLVARAVSTLFNMEDEPSSNIDDYAYPEPETPHPAGTQAQLRKVKQATLAAGDMPILPSVHGYGPLDDVERRWRMGWEGGNHGMWVNRYGYLSQEKLDLLRRVTANR